ncbi:MAG: sulfurtransferase TusA family protein [Prevotella sp.]|nr:sulfurtransferase TusA family protein [Prevotella sp.]
MALFKQPQHHPESNGGRVHVLDITKEHCPMTFVKTKIELSKLQPGDILEVLLAEGEPLDNVPRNAREQGYNVLGVEHIEGTTYKVTILK